MSNKSTTLPISRARKQIFDIAEDVQKPGRHYTLTENGYPKAVVMSAEEYESWAETLEVIQDFPSLSRDIEDAHKELAAGKLIDLADVIKNDVSRKTKPTRQKRYTKDRSKK